MFALLPDRMMGYATAELAAKLAALTTQQRAAIDRIVQHVYVDNLPLAHLFHGDDRICSERRYYDKGVFAPEAGEWRKRPGWHHDKAFQDALAEAVRLALTARTREELAAWQGAKRRARLAAGAIVDTLIGINAASDKDADRVKAGQTLLTFARPDAEMSETTDEVEADWWKAAEDE